MKQFLLVPLGSEEKYAGDTVLREAEKEVVEDKGTVRKLSVRTVTRKLDTLANTSFTNPLNLEVPILATSLGTSES